MTPVKALQAALAAEHAAVYVTGFLGAQASQSHQPKIYADLLAAYQVHRRNRDQLTVLISDRGVEPVAASVAYQLPLAARIAKTFGQLVENTSGAERRWALVALDGAAVRQLEFGGTPEMFPGSVN
jgi:hypothetical protein